MKLLFLHITIYATVNRYWGNLKLKIKIKKKSLCIQNVDERTGNLVFFMQPRPKTAKLKLKMMGNEINQPGLKSVK